MIAALKGIRGKIRGAVEKFGQVLLGGDRFLSEENFDFVAGGFDGFEVFAAFAGEENFRLQVAGVG